MRVCLAFAIFGLGIGAQASASSRPIVLELFTSQGCSSCPPADALLTALAKRRDLLPLAFHVTYWNSLGWRDPYSFQGATDRQALYAARLGGGSYTPEMVVDGRRGMVGSEADEVAEAIAVARTKSEPAVSVELVRDGDALSIMLGAGQGRGRVLLVGFDPRRETRVGRGENGGRTLVESNVVRSLQTVGAYSGASMRVKATRGDGTEAAVLVQAPDGRILGAARL